MKNIFALVLALLMLCGCGTEAPDPTAGETTPTSPAPTEEEAIIHEVLEIHDLPYEDVYAAAPMGDDLLLFSGTAKTTLIKLGGINYKEIAACASNDWISPDDPAVQISESGICYPTETELVFLDENLTETDRVSLPEAWGQGVVAVDQQTIYYSTGSELRVYNRETGLDRPLRETMHSGLSIESLHLNDSVLLCRVWDSNAVPPTLFYSASTGEQLGAYSGSLSLVSDGDLWLANVSDGTYTQTVFGTGSDEIQVLDAGSAIHLVPGMGGVLMAEDGSIRFCDLVHDTETAAVTLDGDSAMLSVWGDREQNLIWILQDDNRLVRWDLTEIEAQDAVSCIAPYYTRENPDAEGLAALETAAEALESTYSVEIHIAEDALAAQPDDAALVSEYRIEALEAGLNSLATALERFTPAFLANIGKASNDGRVHISLVRSAEFSGCIQFWDTEGLARIILPLGESLEQDLCHGLAHIIDARVMSECSAFDNWKQLNPKGFSYDYDYTANRDRDGSDYADAFIDTFAMSFPTEDRARIFEYAMMAGNEEIYASGTIQQKLATLCGGIRKAFGLKDSEEVFPWEQYLAE